VTACDAEILDESIHPCPILTLSDSSSKSQQIACF
jgi:hypothetical protein